MTIVVMSQEKTGCTETTASMAATLMTNKLHRHPIKAAWKAICVNSRSTGVAQIHGSLYGRWALLLAHHEARGRVG